MNEPPAWPCLQAWVSEDPVRGCLISLSPMPGWPTVLIPMPADPTALKNMYSDFVSSMRQFLNVGPSRTVEYAIEKDLDIMSTKQVVQLSRAGHWPAIPIYFRSFEGISRIGLSYFSDATLRRVPLPEDALEARSLYLMLLEAIGYVTGRPATSSAVQDLERNRKRRGRHRDFLKALPRHVDVQWGKVASGHALVPAFPDMPSEAVHIAEFSIGQPGTGK
ncbi:hypothetical protein [Microtetraspora malaysiensis]|uniref:hypothetical protein n=1 Tax=Microtetraspora malaysiensis TaxID=161358 RepID=UPI003D91FD61